MKELFELRRMSEDIYFTGGDSHTYSSKTKPKVKYKSVSGWTKNIQDQFEEVEEYWALYKALEKCGYSIKKGEPNEYYWIDHIMVSMEDANELKMIETTPELILAEWKDNAKRASLEGTNLHYIYEDMWKNKKRDSYESIYNIKKSNPHLITIDTEVIVGDHELGFWGQLDVLLYNTKTKKYQIRDLKTDKEIKTSNRYQKLHPPFEDMDDCNFNIYTIKINMYRYLIERSTSIRIDDELYIDHISKTDMEYTEIKIPYLTITDDIIRDVMSGKNKEPQPLDLNIFEL